MCKQLKYKIDLNSTNPLKNPNIPQPEDRPRCSKRGCKKPQAIIRTHKDGSPSYRKVCVKHHQENIAKKNDVPTAKHLTAQRKGLTVTEYSNQNHRYKKYRKDYCENRDGRLGYKCTTTIVFSGQLEVDHINGNPYDDREVNLQTLCSCCHAYKTHINKDHATPGRKTQKVKKVITKDRKRLFKLAA